MHQFVDRSGDLGVRLEAPTLDALFEQAAAALTDAITPVAGVEPRMKEEVACESTELDLLLVDWLSELLHLFETRQFLASSADVAISATAPYRLSAVVSGEIRDAGRHAIKSVPRAVTYHGLEVRLEDDRWIAQVALDV